MSLFHPDYVFHAKKQVCEIPVKDILPPDGTISSRKLCGAIFFKNSFSEDRGKLGSFQV